ncbi:MAG: ParB/RepB/Spo0J family partition protein [Parvularcula sp.]|nr:ParB/RepB/Spo0J family partition protein [Parvularcula sp.]
MASAIRAAGSAAKEMDARDEDAELALLELAVEARQAREARQHLKLIALDSIVEDHLTRDRQEIGADGLEELKTSIRSNGLGSPIRVDDLGNGRFGLNQGRRRLRAFREIYVETGESQYREIPAIIDRADERKKSYQRMVDENLIRESVSFAELAALAVSYSREAGSTVEEAVETLFGSVSRQKRSDIMVFVNVLSVTGDLIRYPRQIGRETGRRIAALVSTPEGKDTFLSSLLAADAQSAKAEAVAVESALSAKRPKAMKASARREVRKLRVKAPGGQQLDFAVTEKRIVISAKGLGAVSDEMLKRIGALLESSSPRRH